MKRSNVKLLSLVFLCVSGCHSRDSAQPPAIGEQAITVNSNKPSLVIGAVEFFADWNGSYVKLEQWKDTSDPQVPHPEVFDIICQIENRGDSVVQHGEFIVVTTIDAAVAPSYLHQGDLNKIITEVGWTRVVALDDVKMEIVPYLEAKARQNVKIPGVKVEALARYFNGEKDTFWPWALRVKVHLLNRDMSVVAGGQAILPMIPSDQRLPTRGQ